MARSMCAFVKKYSYSFETNISTWLRGQYICFQRAFGQGVMLVIAPGILPVSYALPPGFRPHSVIINRNFELHATAPTSSAYPTQTLKMRLRS